MRDPVAQTGSENGEIHKLGVLGLTRSHALACIHTSSPAIISQFSKLLSSGQYMASERGIKGKALLETRWILDTSPSCTGNGNSPGVPPPSLPEYM